MNFYNSSYSRSFPFLETTRNRWNCSKKGKYVLKKIYLLESFLEFNSSKIKVRGKELNKFLEKLYTYRFLVGSIWIQISLIHPLC